MSRSDRPWKTLINNLEHHLQVVDEEMKLLGFIDRSILTGYLNKEKGEIESTYLTTLERFSEIHNLKAPPLCYVFFGDKLGLLESDTNSSYPVLLNFPKTLSKIVKQGDSKEITPRLLIRAKHAKDLFQQLSDINTILLCPLYSPTGDLLCLLLLPDSHMWKDSQLTEDEFQEFFGAMSSQLSIAYNHFLEDCQRNQMAELWELFLSSDLSPTRCFRNLAEKIPLFLPSFGPLKLNPEPEVQILLLQKSPQTGKPIYLTIRATTREEPDTTRIDIHNSICGLLVQKERDELPYFCDDPRKRKYGTRYKNYLGVGKKRPIKTEFAVRLHTGADFVGILNLESELENAFSIHHIETIQVLTKHIAPMVAAFEERLNLNKALQYSLGDTASRYLDSLASIFKHGIDSPLLSQQNNLFFIHRCLTKLHSEAKRMIEKSSSTSKRDSKDSRLDEVLSETKSALRRFDKSHSQIRRYIETFTNDIKGIGQQGRRNLLGLLKEVKQFTLKGLLQEETESIAIRIKCPRQVYVFCSPLIKQHIYCLLHNAILSIQERMKENPKKGVIDLSVSKDLPANKLQERELNARWIVRIRDNGMGVKAEQLEKLREFRAGTRFRRDQGLGYGMVAAQRYIASIGGRIELSSTYKEYFEVAVYLDEYRDELHGPLSAHRT